MTTSIRSRLRIGLATIPLAAILVVRPARAEVHISIQYDSEERLQAARRLFSELSAEGYVVELTMGDAPSPCEAIGARLATIPRDTRAWVRLQPDPSGADAIVASICYLGALPFVQQATSSAPSSDPRQLAVATAEALNGLRSKLPPMVGEFASSKPRDPSPSEPKGAATPSAVVNGVGLGMALWKILPDYPTSSGVLFRATLGASVRASLAVEAFVATGAAERAAADVTATIRSAWLRLGPRLGLRLGDFEVCGAVLAGPVVTWATARARTPRVGAADVEPGALVSISASVEYPRQNPIFFSASVAGSALLPGLRLRLGDGEPSHQGSWPIDASVGVGARWGASE
jgi:hypothetical protein